MKSINMHDAKTNLSRYVAKLAPGDSLVLCNRNQPVAEIRLLAGKSKKPRIGAAKGLKVPDSFFDRLPESVLKKFSGE